MCGRADNLSYDLHEKDGRNSTIQKKKDLTSHPLMQWRNSGCGYHFSPIVQIIFCQMTKKVFRTKHKNILKHTGAYKVHYILCPV